MNLRVRRTVKVTEEDIRQGDQRDCHSCPVALAVGRELNSKTKGKVRPAWLRLEHENGCALLVDFPLRVRAWIHAYDWVAQNERGGIHTFEFEIELPAWAVKENPA